VKAVVPNSAKKTVVIEYEATYPLYKKYSIYNNRKHCSGSVLMYVIATVPTTST
jgi:ribosomal protein S17